MNSILIRDPATNEIVQTLDPDGERCYYGPCGDCVSCLERIALHGGFIVEYEEDGPA